MPKHDTGNTALNQALDRLAQETARMGDSMEYRLPAGLCAAISGVLSHSGRA